MLSVWTTSLNNGGTMKSKKFQYRGYYYRLKYSYFDGVRVCWAVLIYHFRFFNIYFRKVPTSYKDRDISGKDIISLHQEAKKLIDETIQSKDAKRNTLTMINSDGAVLGASIMEER